MLTMLLIRGGSHFSEPPNLDFKPLTTALVGVRRASPEGAHSVQKSTARCVEEVDQGSVGLFQLSQLSSNLPCNAGGRVGD